MIFKICSFLTFALALASLDAVTATFAPKNVDAVGPLNSRAVVPVGVAQIYILSPERSNKWVFCFLIYTAMLKSSSNSIINSTGVVFVIVHWVLDLSMIRNTWVVFIFFKMRPSMITQILHNFSWLPYLWLYVENGHEHCRFTFKFTCC